MLFAVLKVAGEAPDLVFALNVGFAPLYLCSALHYLQRAEHASEEGLERRAHILVHFCLSFGEAIHAKDREGQCGSSAERSDKVGVRQTQTRRAGLAE